MQVRSEIVERALAAVRALPEPARMERREPARQETLTAVGEPPEPSDHSAECYSIGEGKEIHRPWTRKCRAKGREVRAATARARMLALQWLCAVRVSYVRREPAAAHKRAMHYLPWKREGAGMGTLTVQYQLAALLEMRGARPRGNRADCPRCKRQRAVSFDESRGVYHCHGHGCDFSGNTGTLARELGLARRLSPAEYRAARENRERSDQAARVLYEVVKARRMESLGALHDLNRLESVAHDAGPDSPETWDSLALVYADRPGILTELAILENSTAADLVRFLSGDSPTRAGAVGGVIERAELYDTGGKFIGVG